MTELEEEAEKGEDSQTGKASDTNTQVQCSAALVSCWPLNDPFSLNMSDYTVTALCSILIASDCCMYRNSMQRTMGRRTMWQSRHITSSSQATLHGLTTIPSTPWRNVPYLNSLTARTNQRHQRSTWHIVTSWSIHTASILQSTSPVPPAGATWQGMFVPSWECMLSWSSGVSLIIRFVSIHLASATWTGIAYLD